MPSCWRHPQNPSFAQTGTQNYDPFSLLLSIITLEEMTIKHSLYMWKVPLYYTEKACVVFPGFEIHPGRKVMTCKVLQVFQTRGTTFAFLLALEGSIPVFKNKYVLISCWVSCDESTNVCIRCFS